MVEKLKVTRETMREKLGKCNSRKSVIKMNLEKLKITKERNQDVKKLMSLRKIA